MGCRTPEVSGAPELVLTPNTTAVAVGGAARFDVHSAGGGKASVTWFVNGVAGGNATTGVISPGGVYTPASFSTPTVVTIRAVSTTNTALSASATVYVLISGGVTATGNPLVAQYSILTFPGSTVTVQFGPDVSYGLKTSAVPASAGAPTTILVAGMKASSTYHVQGLVQLPDGTQFTDADTAFTTGALSAAQIPAITATTAAGATPASGVELLALNGGSAVNVVATDLQGNLVWYYNVGIAGEFP